MAETGLDLQTLRARIDATDAELLRLIETRAALARAIAASKTEILTTGSPSLLRPDREALLLRKLAAGRSADTGEATVIRIWRELIGQSLNLQYAPLGGLKAALAGTDPDIEGLQHQIPARFGALICTMVLKDASAVITLARQADHIGVLSLRRGAGAWWARLLAEPKVRIFGALPQGLEFERLSGLCIGNVICEPSGNDLSLMAVDLPASDREVVGQFSTSGLAAEIVASDTGLRLVSLSGFVQEDDPRITGIFGGLSGLVGYCPLI